MPRLTVNLSDGLQKVYELRQGTTTLGRGASNDIILSDPTVSRRHARIELDNNQAVLVDQGSTSGTYRNGVRIERESLAHGDIIKLGSVTAQYDSELMKVVELTTRTYTASGLTHFAIDRPSSLDDSRSTWGATASTHLDPNSRNYQRKLGILLDVSRTLSSGYYKVDDLLHHIIDLLFQIMRIDRAVILLHDKTTDELIPRICHPELVSKEDVHSELIISRTITRKVLEEGVAILTSDARADERFDDAQSIVSQAVRSAMCVPLQAKETVVGVLYVDNLGDPDCYNDDDLEFLAAFASHAAIALENANLYEATVNMKNYVENILQSITNAIIAIDLNGIITQVNLEAERILKMKSDALVGTHYAQVPHLDQLQPFLEQALQEGQFVNHVESKFVLGLDLELILDLGTHPLRDRNEQTIGVLLVFRDVTKLKLMEEGLRRADRLATIGQMAAGISHEIRNPLTSIKAFSELIYRDAAEESRQRRFASIVVEEVDRLNGIVEGLLSFAKEGKGTFEPQDVKTILEETLRLAKEPIMKSRIEVIKHYEDDLPLIPADKNKLKQVLLNLILNAVQAMKPNGTLTLSLSAENLNPRLNTAAVIIAITDTGPGISHQQQEKIFDPFFTTKREGTGLGLAITQQIVKSHDGFLELESEMGVGTTFRVILPQMNPSE